MPFAPQASPPLAALLAPAAPASALSCVDPEAVLVGPSALIGTLVARDGDRLTFDVGEVVRGELPDPLVLRDELADDFPLPTQVGDEVGLAVREVHAELRVNQCGLVPPARLREARAEGWPRGVLTPARTLVVARQATARMRVGCFRLCAGKVVLRAEDGAA